MIEIRIHGRGGQGAVTASELLAIAAFKDGKFTQAFPKFGPERGGAPVEAYCRIDDKFVLLRTDVYEPNYLIVLDKTLLKAVDVTKGLQKDGIIVINSDENIKLDGFKTYFIDATKIALETLGRPIVNTTALGAFVAFTNLVSLKALEAALAERFSGEMLTKNVEAVKRAYDVANKMK